MTVNPSNQKPIILWVITGVLILFLAVVGGLAFELRKLLRSHVINRDGEVFMVVASAEVDRVRVQNEGIFDSGADEELLEVALNTSEIRGILGVQVYKNANNYVGAFPISIKRSNLELVDELELLQKRPISRYHASMKLADIFFIIEEEDGEPMMYPILEILIPLFSLTDGEVSGFAQYYMDAGDLALELEELDDNVLYYAGGAFVLGALLSGGLLYWAFRKLREVNTLLEDRTRNLISANHKLSMESRTAAIGAITSHLIHGLKSPLQGIRQFVTAYSNGEGNGSDDAVWQDAAETTEQMQKLINEVMEVLQDRGSEYTYDLNAREVGTLVDERVFHYAETKGIVLKLEESGPCDSIQLPNDRANLIVLILVNLVRNAIDASHQGTTVKLCIHSEKLGNLRFEVLDKGEGLPDHVVENLFKPVMSSKQDGSGIGLSLCQELARHLDGQLELADTGPQGTIFRLKITTITATA
tara:strand:- start:362 stop:1780 length:1419 start_codon:yes stop_codon:yes gene_type:complete